MALSDDAILHAILAISGRHFAVLQNQSFTWSLKHYHLALRRVARSVGLPGRRGQPATLAAALLLGYFEVMSADPQKWINHLLGASQLVQEIDFESITSHLKNRKAQRNRSHQYQGSRHQGRDMMAYHGFDNSHRGQSIGEPHDGMDESLLQNIMGERHWRTPPGNISAGKTYTAHDVEVYEIQRDLFWWYCRQDVYQSFIGGGKLL